MGMRWNWCICDITELNAGEPLFALSEVHTYDDGTESIGNPTNILVASSPEGLVEELRRILADIEGNPTPKTY